MVIRGNRMVAGEFTSRERLFIECHIARHYDRAVGWIPKLIPLGTRLIPHEDHLDSLLVEFPFALCLLHVYKGFAPEHSEVGDVRNGSVPLGDGALPFVSTHRLTIVDMNGCINGELPETVTKTCLMEHGHGLFDDSTVPALSASILLRRARHSLLVLDPVRTKKLRELGRSVFSPSVRADLLDLSTGLGLSPRLVVEERLERIRLRLKVVSTGESGVVINETGEILVTSDSLCAHRAIKIGVNEPEWFRSTLIRRREGETSGFAPGTSLTRFIFVFRGINRINPSDVLREMAQRVLAEMTKATVQGTKTADVKMNTLAIVKFELSPVDIAQDVVLRFKDLATLDSNRRTKFDSAFRQLVKDAHLPISLDKGVPVALNGACREDTTSQLRDVVHMGERDRNFVTINPSVTTDRALPESKDHVARISSIEADGRIKRLILGEVT